MAISVSTPIRNAFLAAIAAAANAGAGAGQVRIYSGTRPAQGGGAITTQQLLATVGLGDPAFATPANGVMAATATTPGSITTAGTAAWFRITDSDGNFVADGNVGTSGADLNFSSVNFTVGVDASISNLTLTAGNA